MEARLYSVEDYQIKDQFDNQSLLSTHPPWPQCESHISAIYALRCQLTDWQDHRQDSLLPPFPLARHLFRVVAVCHISLPLIWTRPVPFQHHPD